jgi:hypothetical protein
LPADAPLGLGGLLGLVLLGLVLLGLGDLVSLRLSGRLRRRRPDRPGRDGTLLVGP